METPAVSRSSITSDLPNFTIKSGVTGVVVQTESGIVKAIVDLGVLPSATGFSASGNASLTIAEADGLKITEFVMGFPYYTPENLQKSH